GKCRRPGCGRERSGNERSQGTECRGDRSRWRCQRWGLDALGRRRCSIADSESRGGEGTPHPRVRLPAQHRGQHARVGGRPASRHPLGGPPGGGGARAG
ncbi:unnamed protein product, partial [Ectocarpus sp. 12 AP-2014]